MNIRPMSELVAGVDGCRGGWLCVLWDPAAKANPRVLQFHHFGEVLSLAEEPARIAVDIPIGLPRSGSKGGRLCDNAARRNLGPRQSALFAVPARAALEETDYARACTVALANSNPPRKVSKQCFNLFAKIREVDALMTPALQERVRECHPETAFWAMNGRQPLAEPKKVKSQLYPPGLALRRRLLQAAGFPHSFLASAPYQGSARSPHLRAGEDDLLDACACAWTAARLGNGAAIRFPQDTPDIGGPEVDAKGLRMEIWA
jgi:predicted RNase H-like nuclease